MRSRRERCCRTSWPVDSTTSGEERGSEYGVDPEFDENRAGDGADADAVEKQIVPWIVHKGGVRHGGHLHRCVGGFGGGCVHHGHEELIGVQ